jgi:hemerythrin
MRGEPTVDRIKDFGTAAFATTCLIDSEETPDLMGELLQREHRELFTWMTYYNHAVAQGTARNQLLAIFDATFECVKKHFRSVDALLEQTSWQRFQRHHAIHCQITDELAAYRIRLAGDGPLDAVECAHVLDALLIQFIREQPMFTQLHARLDHEYAQ